MAGVEEGVGSGREELGGPGVKVCAVAGGFLLRGEEVPQRDVPPVDSSVASASPDEGYGPHALVLPRVRCSGPNERPQCCGA